MSDFETYDLVRLRCLHKARLKLQKVVKQMDEREKDEVVRLHTAMTERDEPIDAITAGGTNFSPYEDDVIYVDDAKAFEEWALANEPTLLQDAREARKQQLNQEVRRREDDGLPLPPGVMKGQPRPKISMTKSRRKG